MKVVDEPQETQNTVGVTFQRVPFATEIDILPKMNPLEESKVERVGDVGGMSPLTSVQTEERLKEAVQHRAQDDGEEFMPIPLKRIDSGPHQHHIQGPASEAGTRVQPTENNNVHSALLDEIDQSIGPKTDAKATKTSRKENTLKRMLKGIRVEKSNEDESDDKLGVQVSISRIFQRINPVGKVSRENFSKVFHRIGDALQKKNEVEDGSVTKGQTLDNRGWNSQPESAKSGHGEQRLPKIGEKMFRCRPSNTDARKTTG